MTMTKTQVVGLLKENRNERGIANWKKRGAKNSGLKSLGIGLTQLRKLAKQVGRDHKLAQRLWKSDIYDAKVIGLLIDDPKQISREQVEEQVEGLHGGMLAHMFASCGATLAKTSFLKNSAWFYIWRVNRGCWCVILCKEVMDNDPKPCKV